MPNKKLCTCDKRSNKRCPVHSSAVRRRVLPRLQKAPESNKIENFSAKVNVFQGFIKIGLVLLQAVHLMLFW